MSVSETLDPSIQNLRISRCRFTIRAVDELRLCSLPGVQFSEGAGRFLNHLWCSLPELAAEFDRGQACQFCILQRSCPYVRYWRSLGSDIRSHVVEAIGPAVVAQGDAFEFDLLLFGETIDSLGAWIIALNDLGVHGIYRPGENEDRRRFSVLKVVERLPGGCSSEIYDGDNSRMSALPVGASLQQWCESLPAVEGLIL
ncbi:MAG TPA: hypothetical protein PKH07_20535, partial [bacterium]|nr:hypothetical protein [bacterium]